MSEEPERLARGFGSLGKVVRELQVDDVGLWPRFEHGLATALERRPPRVFELRQRLGGGALRFQRAIVVAIEACCRELRGALAGTVLGNGGPADNTAADGGGGGDAARACGRRQSLDVVLKEGAKSSKAFFVFP